MDANTKVTSTAQLIHAAAATIQADDGVEEGLANLHVVSMYPDGLVEQAEAALQVLAHVGLRNPADRELILSTVVAVLSGQVEDLRERVAHLELEKSGATA